jgi:hypothetical protein
MYGGCRPVRWILMVRLIVAGLIAGVGSMAQPGLGMLKQSGFAYRK